MKNWVFALAILAGLSLILSGCQPQLRETDKKAEKMKVAVLVAEGFHDGEAYMPIGFLLNQGAWIQVIGPDKGQVKAYNSDFTIEIQQSVGEVAVDDFDALIIPGGRAPGALRENEQVLAFVRAFVESGKPVAAICHGPQVLISAGVMEGITTTGFHGIREELEAAGALYKDEAVVLDGNLITSRTPPDLYAFSRAIKKALF